MTNKEKYDALISKDVSPALERAKERKRTMEGKEWFEKSKYVYDLEEHDESGYLGIDENKVAEMLDEYYQYKLKLLGRIVDDYLNSK